ncbi:MAG: hypothetical protein JNL42_01785 [Anaerolineae bacterium]|nr:hypothetical protein [Anaerolineae bacterium]
MHSSPQRVSIASMSRFRGFRALLIGVLLIVAIAARLIPGARTIDDAFITFRYARNIVEGQGFVYNPGVSTLGTTTPLFTLLLTAASALSGSRDFPQIAIVLSAAADAVTAALLYAIARRVMAGMRVGGEPGGASSGRAEARPYEEILAALPGLLWAVSPMSVTFAVGGMETSVSILWMTAAVAAFLAGPSAGWVKPAGDPPGRPYGDGGDRQRRSDWDAKAGDPPGRPYEAALGIFAALGLLTRADAVLWAAPLLGWQLVERLAARRGRLTLAALPWRTWIACTVILLPWAVYATAAFGSPIPNSVTAKRYAYLIPDGAALIRMIQTYATPFFEFDTFGSLGAMFASVAYLLLSLVAISFAARRAPRLLPWLIYPWLYLVVFAVLNPLIFRWYMAPPLPALMMGIVVGAWALTSVFRRTPLRWALLGAAGVLWLFMSINGWTLHPDHGTDRPAPRMAFHALELEYQRMAEYLRDDLGVTETTRVASGDIGAVGYFSRATIIDTVGLVTPELTRYYPVDPALVAADQNYAIPPALIYDTQPEYLVTMEGFVRQGLAREARFLADYRLIREQPFPFYGTAMQLFQRQEASSTD